MNNARLARNGLIVLSLINLFNYLDRYVVAALTESLKNSPLHPTDAQLGLLGTSFLVVYTLTAPLFGRAGDRGPRARLLGIGVFIWSLATAGAGLVRTMFQLLVARALVGVGEAAYGTVGPSLLADYYPRERRGRVFAIFFMAIPVGSALGFVVGGLADHLWGWRSAFFIAGGPGLILALLAARLWDAPRGAHDEPAAPSASGLGPALRSLAANRSYVLTVLGYAAYTFALGGLAYWMAGFLERVRHVPKTTATSGFGGIVVLTGLVGTALGGWLGDRWLRRTPRAYLALSGIATLLAAPFFALALLSPAPAVFWPAMIVAQLLMFASTGPINSQIVNVVHPAIRTTGVAVSVFTIHALGDCWSPLLVGVISDHAGLGMAVLILPGAAVLGGLIWVWAATTKSVRGMRTGEA
ncbi:MAG TPA: MFS transporter [Gemmatimonadales bacterium]|nr:MFS transporter [Gemmatimonadales bacterium]